MLLCNDTAHFAHFRNCLSTPICRSGSGPSSVAFFDPNTSKVATIISLTFDTASSSVSPDELMFASKKLAIYSSPSRRTTTANGLIISTGSGKKDWIGTIIEWFDGDIRLGRELGRFAIADALFQSPTTTSDSG